VVFLCLFSPYIAESVSLLVMCMANIFFQFVSCLFTLFMTSFYTQSFFVLGTYHSALAETFLQGT
jgi:hypothetical protein